ncbi:RNA exonuclease 1 homolog isoform X2 [Hyperolius riggenbachi]|uniref:RNA exonuclease 1 homolog isoform X2 n=1 Tax=Hyperolius riggenbachi TaxID=752182 RepID=UPI0035A3672D
MLKSTSYFRGVECPFRETCRRPYCHFRHRGRLVRSDVGGGEARNSTAEYDPYSPELPPIPSSSLDNDILGVVLEPSRDILELEKVNKAIEEVKNEVEREQRKYEVLLETQKEYNPTPKRLANPSSFSPLEYDPIDSGKSGLCYNPTLLSHSVKPCKYTLDDLEKETIKKKCIEYVPSKISKHNTKKYVIDNSKPCTDMEYDPMSNYSARLLSKGKHQKMTKRSRVVGPDDSCAPCIKKSRSQTSDVLVQAKFSDSEDDSGTPILTNKNSFLAEAKDKTTRTVKESAVQHNVNDVGNRGKDLVKVNPVQYKGMKKSDSGKNKTIDKGLKREKSKKVVRNSVIDAKNGKMLACDEKTKKNLVQNAPRLCAESLSVSISLSKNKRITNNAASKPNAGLHAKESKHVVCEIHDKFRAKKLKSESFGKSKEPSERTAKSRTKQRTLSHVDLFGDESSGEEEENKNKSSSKSCNQVAKKTNCTPRRSSTSSVDSSESHYSILENNLDSDHDTMEECLRVFNESLDVKTEDKGRKGKQLCESNSEKNGENSMPPGQKKRISHVHSNHADSASKPVCSARRPTPQEICYRRIKKAQEQAIELLSQQQVIPLTTNVQKSPLALPGEKKRIAHVPGLPTSSSQSTHSTQQEKSPSTRSSSSSLQHRTLAGMASKTTSNTVHKRRAHIPSLQSATLKRPVIPVEYGAKVPTTIRQRYLNMFIDECLKFCCSHQEAFDKALEEEKGVYSRSSSRNIYLNVAVNTLKKLRNQESSNKSNKVTSQKVNKKGISHKSVLEGKLTVKNSSSVQNSDCQGEQSTDVILYKQLKNYILTPEQLKDHGYPLAHPEKPGKAVVFTEEEKKSSSSSIRICCRCGVEFMVTQSGKYVRQEECVHHWGRLRRQRVPGGWETQYSCCSGAVGSTGCQIAKQHVQDGRKENLDGFVKTFEKLHNPEDSPGVFALDCEMCYTTKGLELTRITVINSQLKVVYDTFVQPDSTIVDYNTSAFLMSDSKRLRGSHYSALSRH